MATLPFFGDQPFWGRRVQALGLGPEPLRRPVTILKLVEAIAALEELNVQHNAEVLGRLVQAEKGVEVAVDFIERQAAINSPSISAFG